MCRDDRAERRPRAATDHLGTGGQDAAATRAPCAGDPGECRWTRFAQTGAPAADESDHRSALACRVHGRWQGQPLWADEYVLSADEKTSIQARHRVHPTLPPGPHQAARVEHEYQRRGALQYLAAWDVHRAVVFGRCEPKTGKAPFGRLVDQVMSQEPYRSARCVFWIADNGSSHRGERAGVVLPGASSPYRRRALPA